MTKAVGVLLGFAVAAIACAAQAPAGASQSPIAEIGAKPVYERDIAARIQGRLIQLQSQEYQIKKQALESYIDDQVVADEAKAGGVTAEALVVREVDAKIPQPTDDAVRAYYVAQPNLQGRPFDEIKDQLRQSLRSALVAKARKDYIAALRAKANVQVLLDPPRFHVTYDPARFRGNPKAPVTIVEFSDFQCPYCRGVEPTLRQIQQKYADKVSFAYRDFPLRSIHPQAELAAEAARCAQDQGKFWEYHDLLMADPPRLDRNSLAADAATLHLDAKQFDSCLSSSKPAAVVQQDLDAGEALGVNGTPGFFVNGVALSGNQPLAVFEQAIREAIESSQRSGRTAGRR
ncbi:MAG TPA: thioredoxin domain-containing protein [Candidatus Acidoferrales bacterium]|nr:thioredoxin domain-containing protein [Candidatus Acidoferrales bacterium]